MSTPPSNSPTPPPESSVESSTGLDSKIGGLLCYLLGFLSGIAFLVIEQKDREVRFHAYQSTATFLGLFILSVVASFVPVISLIVSLFLPIVSLVVWLLLMFKAFSGEHYKLPLVGDWAEEQVR